MKIIKGVSPWSKKNTYLLIDKNKKVILANDNKTMLEEAKSSFVTHQNWYSRKILNKTKN